MSDEPIFYDKNYIDGNSVITVSSGDSSKQRFFDKDFLSQWKSVGEGDPTDISTIEILFYEGGVAAGKYLTDIFIQNTNIDIGYISYLTSLGWEENQIFGYSTNKIADLVSPYWTMRAAVPSNIAAKLVYGIKFSIEGTRYYYYKEKEIGEILALKSLLTVARTPDKFAPSYDPIAIINRAANGDMNAVPIKWAGDKVHRWAAKMTFNHMTAADKSALMDIAKLERFIIRPEPTANPNDIYMVSCLDKAVDVGYSSEYKGAGYNVVMEMREV